MKGIPAVIPNAHTVIPNGVRNLLKKARAAIPYRAVANRENRL